MDSLPNVEFCINDGVADHLYIPGYDLKEQCRNAIRYLDCRNGSRCFHEKHLRILAERSADLLTLCHEWITQMIEGHNHEIRLNFTDGTRCAARAQRDPLSGSDKKYSAIDINLGSIPVLFGCANRIKLIIEDDLSASGFVVQHLKNWCPDSDPVGVLAFDMDEPFDSDYEIVLDAIQLMYFHEVSHLLLGHLYFPVFGQPSHVDFYRYWRTAESEADCRAGWLFMAFHSGRFGSDKLLVHSSSAKSIVRRLMLAGMSNYLSIQLLYESKPEAQRYYLPPTRLLHVVAGANWARTQMGVGLTDSSIMELLTRYQIATEFAFSDLLPNWISTGSDEANEDLRKHLAENPSLMTDVMSATLKHRKFKWTFS